MATCGRTLNEEYLDAYIGIPFLAGVYRSNNAATQSLKHVDRQKYFPDNKVNSDLSMENASSSNKYQVSQANMA